MYCMESRFFTGPSNTLFGGVMVCMCALSSPDILQAGVVKGLRDLWQSLSKASSDAFPFSKNSSGHVKSCRDHYHFQQGQQMSKTCYETFSFSSEETTIICKTFFVAIIFTFSNGLCSMVVIPLKAGYSCTHKTSTDPE